MADKKTLVFTDANFDADVLLSGVPVLVDVWAEGCGGCRQLAPLIDVVASEYAGKGEGWKTGRNVEPRYRYAVPRSRTSHIIAFQGRQRRIAAIRRNGQRRTPEIARSSRVIFHSKE